MVPNFQYYKNSYSKDEKTSLETYQIKQNNKVCTTMEIIHDRKPLGRPKKRWKDDVNKDLLNAWSR